MSQPQVTILDYGYGNIRSAQRALEKVGAAVEISHDVDACLNADGLLVPGVGAFGACMEGLNAVAGARIIGTRLAGGRPVLGICVGMQIMFDGSTEFSDNTEREKLIPGCGQWPGKVEKLNADVLPHMGWNTVNSPQDSLLFSGLSDSERFYFVHSYGVRDWVLEPSEIIAPPLVSWATHGEPFVAAVENGALCATQFHPEKSGEAGIHLIQNWLTMMK